MFVVGRCDACVWSVRRSRLCWVHSDHVYLGGRSLELAVLLRLTPAALLAAHRGASWLHRTSSSCRRVTTDVASRVTPMFNVVGGRCPRPGAGSRKLGVDRQATLPVPYQAVGAGCVLSGLSSSFGSTFLSVFFYHEHRVVSEGQGTSKYQATCQGNKNTRPLVDSSGFQLEAGQDSGVR